MQAPSLSLDEIQVHRLSSSDPAGRVFWWQNELYRGVRTERSSLYRQILESGLARSLVQQKLLIDTELAPLKLEGFDLVLKHRTVPFVSYPMEWCGEMLKDAALLHLELELQLCRQGLSTQDAHPWNILFDGPKPLFVDFGSIYPRDPALPWVAYDLFRRFFLYPLYLYSVGHGRIARVLLFENEQGVLKPEFDALVGIKPQPAAEPLPVKEKRSLLGKLLGKKDEQAAPPKKEPNKFEVPDPQNYSSREAFIKELKRVVEGIQMSITKTEWSGYYKTEFPAFVPSENWTMKHRNVYEILSKTRPATVLDVGSNRGWYSQLAASLGSKVVSFDLDEIGVAALYSDAKEKKSDILPLVMSFRKPSPTYGLNQRFPSAMDRLSCELVMGLALVHHLAFKSRLNFEQIVLGLTSFCKKWLLVEFIPKDDQHVSKWNPERFPWYTLENFQKELSKHYRQIEVLPSNHPPRVLFFCTK